MLPILSAPPRSVPLSLRLTLLFGGFKNVFGWFFVGFGLIFVWAFGGSQALHSLAFYSGELASVEGRVTAVVPTNVRINKIPIHAYQYSYRVDGAEYTGATEYFQGELQPGNSTRIEFPLQNPARSRIAGLDYDAWGVFIAAPFPLIGLAFVVLGLRHGRKGIRLLRYGRVATGELIKKRDTGTRINDQPVFEYSFRFKAADGYPHIATAKTHDREPLESEDGVPGKGEPLLYNPHKPADAVLLDDLPGAPRIGPTGEILGNAAGLVLSLLMPGATVLGHVGWALHVLEII